MEIYGSEVDQYLSAILSHMVAGNFRFFFLIISFLYLSSLMQAKNISYWTIR